MHASCAPSLAYPRARPCLLRGCRLRQFGRTSRKCGASDTYSSEKPRSMMPLTTRPAATRTAPRRIANRMAIPFQGFSRFGVMASLSRGGRPLAPKQRPGAKRKRRVEDREEKEEMRENAGQGKRHQYERDEQQAIDDRWRDDGAILTFPPNTQNHPMTTTVMPRTHISASSCPAKTGSRKRAWVMPGQTRTSSPAAR